MFARQAQIVSLAADHHLADLYTTPEFVDAGGLMSYGPDFAVMARRTAEYVDKILKGAKAAEMPIEQPTRYLLLVNLAKAKVRGITIPESVLLRADGVIK
jgi:putative ABC transport system substrate-binding protein